MSASNKYSFADSRPDKASLTPGMESALAGSQPSTIDVLLMEDDFHTARTYSKALSHGGYTFDIAQTIEEARAFLNTRQYRIFVCDIQMGKEMSLGLLEEVHQDLTSKGTKIVVASAHGNYRYMTEELGADFFLQKPISLEVFLILVARLIDQAALK